MKRSKNINTLKRHAQTITTNRNHKMMWGQKYFYNCTLSGDFYAIQGFCRLCNREVMVIENPAPNEVDIGGSAIAENC